MKNNIKKYALNPYGNSTYFCTKLVWSAWDNSGAKNRIGHYYFAGDMIKSSSLKLAETYKK